MRNTDGAVKTIVEKQSTAGFTANFIAAADVAVSEVRTQVRELLT